MVRSAITATPHVQGGHWWLWSAEPLDQVDVVVAVRIARPGRAEWQVRVEPPSHHELRALARSLEAEGLSVARRWNYLIASASCEGEAHALSDRIRGYSSVGTRIRVQPGVYGRPPVRAWTLPPEAWW
jgi:hypothetical protein